MSKEISSITKLILQRTSEEGQGFMDHKNPAVLSCGGMYLPRPKTALPPRVVYHVLNLANKQEPIKIYIGRRAITNLLHQVLAKEALN
ncbi:MAG: hypothetical protein A2W61_03580 [Deltaproteobacteria bacterium RIFCSPLOWO2_01_44_7]|nr:MAG: hypothetical protein A2712_08425 [Deltaproteobacteria bacterium RIFCSPHIGHO2_01_FULL_43_49]OGQ14637.1 MAG: hypothetical protein A3D22_08575 [Deltaproteobacteria bacterium RIFCSPHIGHO2_02_FULL_44_53]OGQ28023.1 MAG: hypothetical protein A3D98_07285 [Deltaproteobacteria bacterium RIFCSPHIGHO2_12_FULL_44_21]OGQ31235.1 MAG: hypothetical protein A2979_07335 [Deltaproteobacteria bacterium RIFCSPLOWO2_01_FULL_45_74]OGQ42692.1 MAG: hypothetical protein A2W61_03580 [Deltaproteobacteria bacterium 